MRYYYKTGKKGKCNCAISNWYHTDDYKTKKAIKDSHMNVKEIWTEKQLVEKYGEYVAKRIMGTAMTGW